MTPASLLRWSLVAVAAVAGTAVAQNRPPPIRPDNGVPEATLYSSRGFQGSGFFMPAAQGDLRLGWPVRSIQVNGRGAWELCDQPQFRGRCITYGSSTGDLGPLVVRSARPVSGGGPQPPPRPPGPGPGPGPWPGGGWTEVGRSGTNYGGDRDIVQIRNDGDFREVQLCAERNPVRLRWAEARFRNGETQRLTQQTTLAAGQCASPVRLVRPPRQLAQVTIAYDGRERRRDATTVIRAR